MAEVLGLPAKRLVSGPSDAGDSLPLWAQDVLASPDCNSDAKDAAGHPAADVVTGAATSAAGGVWLQASPAPSSVGSVETPLHPTPCSSARSAPVAAVGPLEVPHFASLPAVTAEAPRVATTSRRGSGDGPKGDIALCVRLRPVSGDEPPTCFVDSASNVRLRMPPSCRTELCEATYRCDLAFGAEASQEEVYSQAVTPICEAVIRGYNGAVIAYGQTGSGKTHTMLGDMRGKSQGIAPRAVVSIFAALGRCPAWRVEVSVLEIYNERVRDLLAPGPHISLVEIHEFKTNGEDASFRCPDATSRQALCPEDALAALQEGMRRRETARTDMNHHSSRSHLIFTMCIAQTDTEAGATLRSRLHLVDLAGSERLKRSMASDGPSGPSGHASHGSLGPAGRRNSRLMALSPRSPRDQRREAGEINRSLSQLALVIQRLTTAGGLQYVPYRDSCLTRLLAESFGGSSKTCLIITCSAMADDREETKGSLEFGRRAKLVRNKPMINLEVQTEPSMVFRAVMEREMLQLMAERDALLGERAATEERRARAEALLGEVEEEARAQRQRQAAEAERLRAQHLALERDLELARAEASDAHLVSAQAATRLEGERRGAEERLERVQQELQALRSERDAQVRGLERQQQDLRSAWEQESAELRRRLAAETREVTRLRQCREDLARLQEERTFEASRAEVERATLARRLEEERSRWSHEKAGLLARAESEKLAVHQGWHEAAAHAFSVLQERAPRVLPGQGDAHATLTPRRADVGQGQGHNSLGMDFVSDKDSLHQHDAVTSNWRLEREVAVLREQLARQQSASQAHLQSPPLMQPQQRKEFSQSSSQAASSSPQAQERYREPQGTCDHRISSPLFSQSAQVSGVGGQSDEKQCKDDLDVQEEPPSTLDSCNEALQSSCFIQQHEVCLDEEATDAVVDVDQPDKELVHRLHHGTDAHELSHRPSTFLAKSDLHSQEKFRPPEGIADAPALSHPEPPTPCPEPIEEGVKEATSLAPQKSPSIQSTAETLFPQPDPRPAVANNTHSTGVEPRIPPLACSVTRSDMSDLEDRRSTICSSNSSLAEGSIDTAVVAALPAVAPAPGSNSSAACVNSLRTPVLVRSAGAVVTAAQSAMGPQVTLQAPPKLTPSQLAPPQFATLSTGGPVRQAVPGTATSAVSTFWPAPRRPECPESTPLDARRAPAGGVNGTNGANNRPGSFTPAGSPALVGMPAASGAGSATAVASPPVMSPPTSGALPSFKRAGDPGDAVPMAAAGEPPAGRLLPWSRLWTPAQRVEA